MKIAGPVATDCPFNKSKEGGEDEVGTQDWRVVLGGRAFGFFIWTKSPESFWTLVQWAIIGTGAYLWVEHYLFLPLRRRLDRIEQRLDRVTGSLDAEAQRKMREIDRHLPPSWSGN